ncbi:hypothetical protein Bbelb_235860 [Branchiostoma belcheri]|nr:hypothetical protein Bbelb_235860 [Branchiostoma belcheri]
MDRPNINGGTYGRGKPACQERELVCPVTAMRKKRAFIYQPSLLYIRVDKPFSPVSATALRVTYALTAVQFSAETHNISHAPSVVELSVTKPREIRSDRRVRDYCIPPGKWTVFREMERSFLGRRPVLR